MTKIEAIALMESSVNIDDWNQKRELVKADKECGGVSLIQLIIDQGGMCGKTLKKNRRIIKNSVEAST